MSDTLPSLTLNRQFVVDFLAEPAPCFAIGLIEEGGRQFGLLAIRPEEEIPPGVTEHGFNFGHSLYGNDRFEVVHFVFDFYGFGIYNVLLNPNNPQVQTVLANMMETGSYFILAIGSDKHVTAFRSEMNANDLMGLKANLARIQVSATDDIQYCAAVRQFERHPEPPGQLLTWVCRDDPQYLDLTKEVLNLTPRHNSSTSGEGASGLDRRHVLAKHLDDRVNKLVRRGDDYMLLAHMADDMHLFKELMDMSGPDGLDDLSAEYPGFFRFAQTLERLALGIQSGQIKV